MNDNRDTGLHIEQRAQARGDTSPASGLSSRHDSSPTGSSFPAAVVQHGMPSGRLKRGCDVTSKDFIFEKPLLL